MAFCTGANKSWKPPPADTEGQLCKTMQGKSSEQSGTDRVLSKCQLRAPFTQHVFQLHTHIKDLGECRAETMSQPEYNETSMYIMLC